MWARATRVEIVIISAVFLVLFMCSKPPKSGRAEVDEVTADLPAPAPFADEAAYDSKPETDQSVDFKPDETPEESPVEFEDEEVPPPPTVGAVDGHGRSKDVMHGEVTVRWIWNGVRFVPRKVCVVEEANGVSSVWSFDQQQEPVLSELSDASDSPR